MSRPNRITRKPLAAGETLKPGALAEALLPPPVEGYESREDLDALLRALRDDLAPRSPTEDMLVRAIAGGFWRLARLHQAEAGAIAAAQDARQPGRTRGDDMGRPLDAGRSLRSRSFPGQVAAVSRALDDPPSLRRLLAQLGRPCAGLPDGSLRDIALQCIADLQERDAERRARDTEAQRARAGLPRLETALALARYETQLHRRIRHNLATLERLQRLRRRTAARRRHRSTLPGLRPGDASRRRAMRNG
jgi:hypothetical protein